MEEERGVKRQKIEEFYIPLAETSFLWDNLKRMLSSEDILDMRALSKTFRALILKSYDIMCLVIEQFNLEGERIYRKRSHFDLMQMRPTVINVTGIFLGIFPLGSFILCPPSQTTDASDYGVPHRTKYSLQTLRNTVAYSFDHEYSGMNHDMIIWEPDTVQGQWSPTGQTGPIAPNSLVPRLNRIEYILSKKVGTIKIADTRHKGVHWTFDVQIMSMKDRSNDTIYTPGVVTDPVSGQDLIIGKVVISRIHVHDPN